MGTSTEDQEYAAFLEKVERTLYVDNMSPEVTEAVLKAACNQFGSVKSIQFIPNYFEPKNAPQAALVEMENPKQAREIIIEMANYPFMVLGMPRPVRGRPATLEMFEERPRKPGRRIVCCWLDPKEPDFQEAQKMKFLVKKHATEASLVLEEQRSQEEMLANKQGETLKGQARKFELLDGVSEDGTLTQLARYYKVSLPDA